MLEIFLCKGYMEAHWDRLHQILKKRKRKRVNPLEILGKKHYLPDEDDEFYCCGGFRIVYNDKLICPKCGSIGLPLIQEYSEDSPEEYHKLIHFNNWLDRIQGVESRTIPVTLVEMIKGEIINEHKSMVSVSDILRYLKKLKYHQYYDHCVKIHSIIIGRVPPQLTSDMEGWLQFLFGRLQSSFKRYRGVRHNLPNYNYIIYKLCELSGYEFHIPISKNLNLIRRYDLIWREVCRYNGWSFIKTVN